VQRCCKVTSLHLLSSSIFISNHRIHIHTIYQKEKETHLTFPPQVVPIPPGVRRDEEEPTEFPTIQPQPGLPRSSTLPCITVIANSSGPSTSNTSTSISNCIDNGKGKEKAVEKEKMEPRTESMRLPKRRVEEQAKKEEHERKRVSFVTARDVLVDRVVRLGKARDIAC
jgi:hypothetical protein